MSSQNDILEEEREKLVKEFINFGANPDHVKISGGNVCVFYNYAWSRAFDRGQLTRNEPVITMAKCYSKFTIVAEQNPNVHFFVVNPNGEAYAANSMDQAQELKQEFGFASPQVLTGPCTQDMLLLG